MNSYRIEIIIDELKKYELNILTHFDQFCRDHDLNYSIAYGTLLGAIRHQGFIPWDDDIDVVMPRHDFEVFRKEFEAYVEPIMPSLKLASSLDQSNGLLFEKIVDQRVVVETIGLEMSSYNYAWVDVFPLDGVGNDLREARRHLYHATLWKHAFLLPNADVGGQGGWKAKLKRAMKKPARAIGLSAIASQKISTYCAKYQYDDSNYISNISWHTYRNDILNKFDYTTYCDLQFEGVKVRSFENADAWLEALYGDYMVLPPESKRLSHFNKAFRNEE